MSRTVFKISIQETSNLISFVNYSISVLISCNSFIDSNFILLTCCKGSPWIVAIYFLDWSPLIAIGNILTFKSIKFHLPSFSHCSNAFRSDCSWRQSFSNSIILYSSTSSNLVHKSSNQSNHCKNHKSLHESSKSINQLTNQEPSGINIEITKRSQRPWNLVHLPRNPTINPCKYWNLKSCLASSLTAYFHFYP